MTKENSDKGNGWHNYTLLYTNLFENIRNEPINIFELGLGSINPNIPSNMGIYGIPGASLFGWEKYFTNENSKCYGADIDKDIIINRGKIKTFYCDQTNASVIREMWENDVLKNMNFDIILDDGLHEHNANITFFENSFHKLKPGGIYIIEDIVKNHVNMFNDTIKNKLSKRDDISYINLFDMPNIRNNHDNVILVIQKK